MNLSDGEKLILLMLSDLHQRLEINGEIDPNFIKTAIINDHLWGIRWKYSGIPFENNEDPEVAREVIEILDMWSFIEFSYQEYSEEEMKLLEVEAKPFDKNPRFIGFDGNNETEYMATAQFIVNDLKRFEEFKGRDFNSHFPSLDGYRKMLSVFESKRKKFGYGPMPVEDMALILKARMHPS